MDCCNLTSIEIPNSVADIGDKAFYECESLTSATIPNSVIYIGEEAFSYCGLTDIEIPMSVKGIGEKAFVRCESLTNVTFGGTKEQWKSLQGALWLFDAKVRVVKCADGDVAV